MTTIPDESKVEEPLTLAASVVLTKLPLDTATALAQLSEPDQTKGKNTRWKLTISNGSLQVSRPSTDSQATGVSNQRQSTI